MKDNNMLTVSIGLSFAGLFTIALTVLKLCSVIKWSWWLVLAHVWIGVTIALVSILIVLIITPSRGRKHRRHHNKVWGSRR
jgi:hypothetical protein